MEIYNKQILGVISTFLDWKEFYDFKIFFKLPISIKTYFKDGVYNNSGESILPYPTEISNEGDEYIEILEYICDNWRERGDEDWGINDIYDSDHVDVFYKIMGKNYHKTLKCLFNNGLAPKIEDVVDGLPEYEKETQHIDEVVIVFFDGMQMYNAECNIEPDKMCEALLLECAAIRGCLNLFKYLHKKIINVGKLQSNDCIQYAIDSGNVELVKYIIENKINIQNNYNNINSCDSASDSCDNEINELKCYRIINSALRQILKSGNTNMIDYLVSIGIKITKEHINNDNYSYYSKKYPENIKIYQKYIKNLK